MTKVNHQQLENMSEEKERPATRDEAVDRAAHGSEWREYYDPPPVGEMVLSQDNKIVWWGGVNWYSRLTQNTTRVLCWKRISTTHDVMRGGLPNVDMSFMEQNDNQVKPDARTEWRIARWFRRLVRPLAAIVDSFPDWLKALMLLGYVTTAIFGHGWATKLIQWIFNKVA